MPEVKTSRFETVEVPTHQLADGRHAIRLQDVVEFPWLEEFVGKFSKYYTFDVTLMCWVSPPEEIRDGQ